MTKQDEINHLEKFVCELKSGYLSDIFKDILPMITDAIRSDFCCIPMRDVWNQKSEYYKEMLQYKNEANKLEIDIKNMENKKRVLEVTIQQAKEKLQNLAQSILGI